MKCEKLNVWKRSCDLSVEVYQYFKKSKDYGFKDQITRSSLSVASNIAEGIEKDSYKENIRFLEIAKGSLAELITQIHIGVRIGYIEKSIAKKWQIEADELMKMITGLEKSFKRKLI